MLITEEIEQKIIKKEVKDVLCNKCGNSMFTQDALISGCTIECLFGYGSDKDGDLYNFHICDKCFDELITTLKIKPEIKTGIF